MRKWIFLPLVTLWLWGCGKSPELAAGELLKAGDRDKAIEVLQAGELKKPDNKSIHYLLFILDEYLVSQGDPAKHDAYLHSAIDEYSWIAKDAGIEPDYRDMEGSIKSKDASRADYESAYNIAYAR